MTLPNNITPLRPQAAPATERRLIVRDLMLSADIGVYRREQGALQRLRVNLDMWIDAAPQSDKLEETVCYATVVDGVRAIVAERHFNLVETLADRILDRCLTDSRVIRARVRLEKLDAMHDAACVGIEAERAAR